MGLGEQGRETDAKRYMKVGLAGRVVTYELQMIIKIREERLDENEDETERTRQWDWCTDMKVGLAGRVMTYVLRVTILITEERSDKEEGIRRTREKKWSKERHKRERALV